jgi:hypothetical protein
MSLRPFYYNSRLGYRDSVTGETMSLQMPVGFDDDFLGATLHQAWTALDTAGATETFLANGASGIYTLALAATNEAELAGLYWNDKRGLVLNQKLIAEFRFRFSVLPTGSVVAVVGLCGDHNAAVNTVAESIWFRADGSGAITVETDDTSHETSQVSTGVTVIANQWVTGRIECETTSAIRFYLDGVRVASGTTFNMSQVAALALQPVARIGKEASATTVGTLQVDAFRCWQERS